MHEEESKHTIRENEGRWQFWFLVSFSLLLLVTFVYYLPLRFFHEASVGGDHAMTEGHAHTALTHEEGDVTSGLAVNFNYTPVPARLGQSSFFQFFVSEKPEGRPVSDLEIEHEKLMHVIGVRSDMNEFFHIHPQPLSSQEPSYFFIQHVFPKPGRYKLWSEVTREGITHSFGHPEIMVEGAGEAFEKEVVFSQSLIVEGYQVIMHLERTPAQGRSETLHFEIHDSLGRDVTLENYLGVPMHLAIIKDDWGRFIHTGLSDSVPSFSFIPTARANGAHVGGEAGHGVAFSVTFPEAGVYKMFAQFRPQGANLMPDDALTAAFWIEAREKGSILSPWWGLLLVSLLLIALLSKAVKKYIEGGSA